MGLEGSRGEIERITQLGDTKVAQIRHIAEAEMDRVGMYVDGKKRELQRTVEWVKEKAERYRDDMGVLVASDIGRLKADLMAELEESVGVQKKSL